jgi:carbamoyl-phosphate synthase large subunit
LNPKAGAEKILISLSEKSGEAAKDAILSAKLFQKLGYTILATEGTAAFFSINNIPCEMIAKLNEGRPNVVDVIVNRQVAMVINTPSAKRNAIQDEEVIRKAASKYKTPYITTLAGAKATAQGIEAARSDIGNVKSIQEYHSEIREIN